MTELGVEPADLPSREVLSLPSRLAEEMGRPVVLYLDELQRAVDYVEGEQALGDLVDLYSARTDVVMLVDGSSERALEGMLGPPVGFGKLCDRLSLAPTILDAIWRERLPERFGRLELALQPAALETLIDFGAGRPYATMAAARYAALNARKLGSDQVAAFEADEGVAEAQRHLQEDA